MITASIILLCVALGVEGYAIYKLRKRLGECQADTERLIQERDQAVASLAANNLKRHSMPTLEMIEDLQAVMLDLEREVRESARVDLERIRKARAILERGRPGPNSYKSFTTADRAVRLWQQ